MSREDSLSDEEVEEATILGSDPDESPEPTPVTGPVLKGYRKDAKKLVLTAEPEVRRGPVLPFWLCVGLAGGAAAFAALQRWRRRDPSPRRPSLTKASVFLKRFTLVPPSAGHPLSSKTFVVSESLGIEGTACRRLQEAALQLEAIVPGPGWLDSAGRTLENPADAGLWHGAGEAASAATVAAGLADAALALDQLGSSRLAAACCGVYCLRCTAGLLPLDGSEGSANPLASTALMASDPALLPRLGQALGLPKGTSEVVNYLVAVDLIAECQGGLRACLPAVISAVKRWAGADQAQSLSLAEWLYHRVASLKHFGSDAEAARLGEAAATESHGPDVLCALRSAARAVRDDGRGEGKTSAEGIAGRKVAEEATNSLLGALQEGYIFVLPTASGAPPARGSGEDQAAFQDDSEGFLALAALAGVPQVVVPFRGAEGEPLSVSLITLHRKDMVLLQAASRLGPLLQEEVGKLFGASSRALGADGAASGPGAGASKEGSWRPFGGAVPSARDSPGEKGPRPRDATAARAEACKEAGNDAFKSGRYDDAVLQYSQALALDPGNAVYYNNRALVYLRLGRYGAAEEDAEASLRIRVSAKALLRRGSARMAMGEAEGAASDFEHVLRLEPNNRQAREELRAIQRFLSTSTDEAA
ncbi:hypothetical protein ACKKBG_A12900 [Auxenochlorella protothecoides x Auxenochlorella symbiontica]